MSEYAKCFSVNLSEYAECFSRNMSEYAECFSVNMSDKKLIFANIVCASKKKSPHLEEPKCGD